MKRLVVFCDGTWNRMSADYPTNVVLAAQAVLPKSPEGIEQLTFYDEGVGTSPVLGRIEAWAAGAFGWGLLEKIAAAYRFLIFNYEPGDEIYIFGFSRGAFTARSLAGLIRKCAIVPRTNARAIAKIFAFYKDPDIHPDDDAARAFRARNSPMLIVKQADRDWRVNQGLPPDQAQKLQLLQISYIGVWDTVGALGIPGHIPLLSHATKAKYQFHDTALSSSVRAARHAVAIDENRRSFEPALWKNLDRLNARAGRADRYQQLYFAGEHGGVGGGGDVVGLSHNTLCWVLEGAQQEGLALDPGLMAHYRAQIDPLAPLRNISRPAGIFEKVYRRAPRVAPASDAEIAVSARYRLNYIPQDPAIPLYRPPTLGSFWPK